MNARVAGLALGCCLWALSGCTLDTSPSGRARNHNPSDAGRDAAVVVKDAGYDAAMVVKDAGHDAGHPPPPRDAGHDAAGPKDDAGHADAAVDAGLPDAGNGPLAPPMTVLHFAGGGTAVSGSYVLRHSIGGLRPTHSPVVPTGVSTSEHYRLSTGLSLPAP